MIDISVGDLNGEHVQVERYSTGGVWLTATTGPYETVMLELTEQDAAALRDALTQALAARTPQDPETILGGLFTRLSDALTSAGHQKKEAGHGHE